MNKEYSGETGSVNLVYSRPCRDDEPPRSYVVWERKTRLAPGAILFPPIRGWKLHDRHYAFRSSIGAATAAKAREAAALLKEPI